MRVMASTLTDRLVGPNGGASIKLPVKCATTSEVTLSGEQTIDGVVTASTDVLVKNQSDSSENGIYTSSTGLWTRRSDANGVRDLVVGTQVFVTHGSINKGVSFVLSGSNPIIVGSSSINWISLGSAYRPVYPINRVSSNVSMNYLFYNWFCNTNNGDIACALPEGVQDSLFRIVNTGASGNRLIITPYGSENLIGENSSFSLFDGEALVITYHENDGWY